MEKKKNDVKEKQEIPKGVGEKRFHFERKQKIAIVVLAIITVASIVGIVGGIIFYINIPKGGGLNVGIRFGPPTIDPLDSAYSLILFDQVVEGLFTTDNNDPNNKVIHNLATSHSWSDDDLELTCNLRQGVKFHDGTPFNATAVKWNFDRLYGMINQTQTTAAFSLLLPDGRWFINETQVIDDYTVKFVLNEPYSPFLGMLTSWTAYILSPTSTPKDEFIDLITGDLVGTGPFIYDSYEPDVEVRMSPNPIYWGGKPAIDELIFSIIIDAEALVDGLLSGNIHILIDYGTILLESMDRLLANLSVTVPEVLPDVTIFFLGMNNKRIPVEMRKAMAYAFDYDYFIEVIRQGWGFRMRSPIPKGVLYSNTEDFGVPVLDLEIARRSLQDANWPETAGLSLDEDGPWEALVDNNTPIATYNYTYNDGNVIRGQLLPLLQDNYKKIGVKIVNASMSWPEYFYRLTDQYGFHRNMLELFPVGWSTDYNDPNNFINELMSNQEGPANLNYAQIDDTQLQTWMEQAVRETNATVREELYYQIQKRFIEEIYPWVMISVPKFSSPYRANLRGYIPNPIKLVLKNAYFV